MPVPLTNTHVELCRRAARLLGLPTGGEAAARLGVERVLPLPGGWHIALGGRELGPLSIVLREARPGERAYLTVGAFAISYESERFDARVDRLLHHVAARLARLEPEAVARFLGGTGPSLPVARAWFPPPDAIDPSAAVEACAALADAVARMGWLLGVPVAPREAPLRVVALRRRGPAWSITLDGSEAPGIELHVDGRETAPGGAAHALVLTPRHDDPGDLVDALVACFASRLARFDVAALTRVVAGDEAGADRHEAEASFRELSEEAGRDLATGRAPAAAWSRFFAPESLEAADPLGSLDVPVVHVEHGDLECQHMGPCNFVCGPLRQVGRDRPARRPPPRLARGPGARRDAAPARPAVEGRGDRHRLFSNLTDLDVIGGGERRLDGLLAAARAHLAPSLMLVQSTCVPEVIGDDTRESARRAGRGGAFPVYYRAQTRRKPYELCVQAMRAAFSQAGGVAREPAVVNLVGLADDRARAELVDLLADLGVAVASTPLPVLTPSPKGARAYLRANASLLVPIRPWQGLYVSLFGGLGVPLVAAPPPYGVEGTRAWASAALAAAGRVQLEPRLDERLSRWREAEWQPRVERAAGHRLGFVCPARELARLVDPARAWGLPLVPVVLEMGFGVDVAIVACGQDEARVAAEAADVLPAPVARTIVSCEAELDAWLTTGGSGAVYSDYFFDDRLLRRGRVPFSRQVFEAGWCGAARTLDRLLRRCTCGFARRFEETA